MATVCARLVNEYKFKYQTVFSARFDKQREDGYLLDEIESFIHLNNNDNLTESDLDNIDVKSSLEHRIQQQEMNGSGWRFNKFNTMSKYSYKTVEMNSLCYVKISLRSNAILNIQNDDFYCFIWSILAYLHPLPD